MIPEILKIGPLGIHSFGLLLVLGLAAGWRALELSLKRAGEDPTLAEPTVFWAGLGGVLGARLFYLLTFPQSFTENPLAALFGGAGFVFYGGFITATFAVWLVLRGKGLSFLRFADLASPAMAFGYAIGRLGCHLSGDGDYGIVTTVPWAFSYSLGIVPTAAGVGVHPTPIYETLMALAIGTVLFVRQTELMNRGAGYLFGLYLVLSSSARFLVEYLRIEPLIAAGLTEAQLISVVLTIIGIILMRPRRVKLIVLPLTAVSIWLSSAMASDYLIKDHIRRTNRQVIFSEKLQILQKAAEKSPKSIAAQQQLARALVREGITKSDAELVMEGISVYRRVLEIDDRHAPTLLELAKLCADQGILDKSAEFFGRYLRERPDDLAAMTDHGLVLVQAGEGNRALAIFEVIIADDPKQFQAQFGKSLALKLLKRESEAQTQAEYALKLAPSDEVRAELKGMMAALPEGRQSSPAASIVNYFKAHAIVGPKVSKISWATAELVNLELQDFPVEKMPAGMKELFVSKAQASLIGIEGLYRVRLLDAQSKAELLSFSVGAASTTDKKTDKNLSESQKK